MRDNPADLFAGLALFSIGGMNQIPADAAVLAVGGGAIKCARQLLLAPCRLFHVLAPSFGFAMHANAGAFRTGFSLAARRSRKSTGFCIFRHTTLYEQLISVCQITQNVLLVGTSPYPSTKTCTFLCNKKKPLNQRLFLFRHEKRRPHFVDGRLC